MKGKKFLGLTKTHETIQQIVLGSIEAIKWMIISSLLGSKNDIISIKDVILNPIQWMIDAKFDLFIIIKKQIFNPLTKNNLSMKD